MGKAVTVQEHFVQVDDDGSETGSTLGTNDTNWTQDADTVFRVRFAITETNGGTENQGFVLRYYHTQGTATWTNVGAATPIKYAESAEDGWTITDTDATTNRPLNWGTGTFTAGEYSEDAVVGVISLTSQFTNVEFCLEIDSAQVNNNDTILLEVWFTGSVSLDSYTNEPTITVKADNTQLVAGTLTFTGTLAKKSYWSLAGALTFTGNLAKKAYESLAGALTSSGTVDGIKTAGGVTTTPIPDNSWKLRQVRLSQRRR